MTTAAVPAADTAAPLSAGDRARHRSSGGICDPCRLSQALGLPHACVTGNPRHPAGTGLDLGPLMYKGGAEKWAALLRALNAHAARPRSGPFSLRAVDASWCVCQHAPTRPDPATGG